MKEDVLRNAALEEQFVGDLVQHAQMNGAQAAWKLIQKTALKPSDFAHENSAEIFREQMRALSQGGACGPIELQARNIDLAWLTNATLKASGFLFDQQAIQLAEQIRDLAIRRRIEELGKYALQKSKRFEDDVTGIIAMMSRELDTVVSGSPRGTHTLDELMAEVAAEIDRAGTAQSNVLPSYIPTWDRIVGGHHPVVTFIGAKPSRGKSGLEATMIYELAARGVKVGIFSLEDKASWLIYRKLSHISRIPGMTLRTRQLNADQQQRLGDAWATVERLGQFIVFDDRSRLSPEEIVMAAREMVLNQGVKIVFVDHRGEMRNTFRRGGERNDLDVTEGLMDVRALSKALDVPIVVLAHLRQTSKQPYTMDDFADSAGISRVARVAVMLEFDSEDSSVVHVSVVKATLGKKDVSFRMKLDEVSAMVVDQEPTQENLL